MSRDLPWREDVQGPVPRFYVDRIEETNLLEPDDVLEVPTDERINRRDRGQGNVPHVRRVFGWQNLASLVRRDETDDLRRDRQKRASEAQHLLVQLSNLHRRIHSFGSRHVRQNGQQPSCAEITDQPIRPLCKLHIEAPA